MKREETKSPKSLSEKLRSRLAQPPPVSDLDEGEQAKVQAIIEDVEQRQFSTIARVMSEGAASSAPRSRGTAVVHRILEQVEEDPGCDVHALARQLGEKSIFVLSHVDDLVREGLLLRLDGGRLYRSRDFLPVDEEVEPVGEQSKGRNRRALNRNHRASIFLRVFRFLTAELGVEPECGAKMTVLRDSGKFFEMRGARNGVNISLYGMFPKELVERFKSESGFDRKRVNYSHLTGIVDIRGCRLEDLPGVLPWIREFLGALNPSEVTGK